MSLVPADETFLLWGVLVALVGFGFWAEKNTHIGRTLTGIVIAMTAAMALSNIGLIPFSSAVYTSVFDYLLPIAIPLMLFRADLLEAFRKGGGTVVAFCIGVVGVLIASPIVFFVIPLGDLSAISAGLFVATYTGGSANFGAVAIATEFNDSTTMAAMIAADIIATNIQTIFLISLPGLVFVRRFFGSDSESLEAIDHKDADPNIASTPTFEMTGVALSLSVALILVFAGVQTAEFLGRSSLAIVFTTVYALIVGNFFKPLVRLMSLDFEIGLFFIFLFLVVLAAGADVRLMLDSGLTFFYYASLMLIIHTTVVIIGGRIFGLSLRNIVIGSTACIGGVTSAAAIASAKGWRDLIVPGVLAGTIGNSFGTLLGVWVWMLLR